MPKYYSPSGNFEVWDEKPDGYFTEQEWAEMHPQTPYIPSKEEKLAALDSQYDSDKSKIMQYYTEAAFADDADLMADLKTEMAAIDAQYIADREKIEQEAE